MKKYLLLGLSTGLLFTIGALFFIGKPQPAAIVIPPAPAPVYVPAPTPAPPVIQYDGPLPRTENKNKIQVAFLLDTSNSMDGLIEQTKSQLWKMVNELADSRKNGKTAGIEIALFEYGNDNLSVNQGYVRQVAGLTSDLDYISQQLFSLRTHGGQEYCGQAIFDAAEKLDWSVDPDDLKIIMIAGNESFAQGEMPHEKAIELATDRQIIVNTIFCGNHSEGVRSQWKEGALSGNGKYMNINQGDQVVHISTPYDDQISQLNIKLNNTYIGYGDNGTSGKFNVTMQDSNASSYSFANSRTRAFFKSKSQYNNKSWDVVDFAAENEVEEIEVEMLPQEMQTMKPEERKKFVEKKSEERKAIQEELREYEVKVKEYIAQQKANNASSLTLDNVMMKALRNQAKAKSFKFE